MASSISTPSGLSSDTLSSLHLGQLLRNFRPQVRADGSASASRRTVGLRGRRGAYSSRVTDGGRVGRTERATRKATTKERVRRRAGSE
jgi:hypothetical protein